MILNNLLTPAQIAALPTGTPVVIYFAPDANCRKSTDLVTRQGDPDHLYYPNSGTAIEIRAGHLADDDKVFLQRKNP